MQHLIAAIVLVVLAGAGQRAQSPAAVVARAGSLVITVDELRDVVREARQSGDPARMVDTLTVDGLERLAHALLDQKRLAQEARARGLDTDPAIRRALTRAADAILSDRLLEREAAALDTSDAALRRYYESHEAAFRTAPRRKARHIVVSTREEAEATLAELAAGRRFEDIAAVRNIDTTKASGGDLGWVPRGIMVKPFEEALFSLERPGQLSGIVQTSFGFHVIRLDEVDPGSLPPFDLIRDEVKQAMRDAAVADLKARLAGKAPATVDRTVLAALVPPGKR